MNARRSSMHREERKKAEATLIDEGILICESPATTVRWAELVRAGSLTTELALVGAMRGHRGHRRIASCMGRPLLCGRFLYYVATSPTRGLRLVRFDLSRFTSKSLSLRGWDDVALAGVQGRWVHCVGSTAPALSKVTLAVIRANHLSGVVEVVRRLPQRALGPKT